MYDKIKDIEYRLVVARFSNLLDHDIKNHVTHLYNVSSETSILPLKSGSISESKSKPGSIFISFLSVSLTFHVKIFSSFAS